MPVEHRTGDLFTTEAQAIGHGCNTLGVMGAGIAVEFRIRYPLMFKEYRKWCVLGAYKPGDAHLWEDKATGKMIFNLMTQPRPGPTARVEFIRTALETAVSVCERNKFEALAIPRVGAGYGGLVWEEVRGMIEEVGSKTAVRILIYSLPGA